MHWNDFLSDEANIWRAAKYLNPNVSSMFDKAPQLVRIDRMTTESEPEQAKELLSAFFFPPLPAVLEDDAEDESPSCLDCRLSR